MNLSTSNILFHFTSRAKSDTDGFEALKGILTKRAFELKKSSFKRHVHLLNTHSESNLNYIRPEIPIVCFTETPLALLKNHMGSFGQFGIGMGIEWGIEKGAQSVIYISDGKASGPSALSSLLNNFMYDKSTEMAQKFNSLIASFELYEYREEREWRFIGEYEILGWNSGDPFPTTEPQFFPKAIEFLDRHVECIVCPGKYLPEIMAHAHSLGMLGGNHRISFIATELLL